MEKVLSTIILGGTLYVIKEDWKKLRKEEERRSCMYLKEKLNSLSYDVLYKNGNFIDRKNTTEELYLNKDCPDKCIEKMMRNFTQRTQGDVGLKIYVGESVSRNSRDCSITTSTKINDVKMDESFKLENPNGTKIFANYPLFKINL